MYFNKEEFMSKKDVILKEECSHYSSGLCLDTNTKCMGNSCGELQWK